MRTTTIEDLTEAIATTIRGLTPIETAMREHRWRLVDDLDLVKSGEVRCFYVDIPPDDVSSDLDGIFSPDSIEMVATMLIYTSYGNVKRRMQRRLCSRDAKQIWLTMELARDATTPNTIAGLIAFDHVQWRSEDDEQARYWGAHTFACRFLAEGLP